MFLISWLLKSLCETKQLTMILLLAVVWDQVTWKPPRQHRAMKTSKCDLLIGNLPNTLEVPALGLFTKGWYWLRGWRDIKLRKSFSSNPESSATQRTFRSPAGKWQPLWVQFSYVWQNWCLSCLTVSHTWRSLCPGWYLSLWVSSAGYLPCLLFLSSRCCEIVFPHPFPILRRHYSNLADILLRNVWPYVIFLIRSWDQHHLPQQCRLA